MYDFDKVIDRYGTSCLKYDFMKERTGREDLLPLWVADMDFRLPEEILEDMHARIDHGVFGYTDPKEDYFGAVKNWFLTHHRLSLQNEWFIITPGVVFAVAAAVCAFTKPGDSVLIQPPVYYPFYECIRSNGRVISENPLILKETDEGPHYEIDFAGFEERIINDHVRLFLLCSPHNPAGRVWTPEELSKIGEICRKYGVIVFSDEIHCDFVLDPTKPHTPFFNAGEGFSEFSLIGTAPSKTFNIAGLQISNIIVPDGSLRSKFRAAVSAAGYSQPNIIGICAARSVYEKGGTWHGELMEYLKGNLDFIRKYLRENLPQLKLIEPEGTYLAWIDCSGLGLAPEELETFILDKAKLWLDSGAIFGEASAQYQRVNYACPRSVLEKALRQLREAADSLKT